jgi:hypothetical protein
MKTETGVIIIKALCYSASGACAALVSGLSQWAADGSWPPPVCWIVIGAAAVGAGATQLLGFFSGSWTNYQADAKANGNGKPTPIPTVP